MSCLQSEEEKMVIENKAREAERIVSQLVDDAERRKEEARELQREVASARYLRLGVDLINSAWGL